MANKVKDYPEWLSWSLFIPFVLFSIVMFIIWIMHTKNVWSDLFTDERKSVKHRRNNPTKTNVYRGIEWCTLLCITFFLATEVAEGVAQGDSSRCVGNFAGIMFTFSFAKAFLFVVFLLRLIQIFGDSQFAYSKNYLLYPLISINAVFGLAVPISAPFFVKHYQLEKDGFPDPCYAQVEPIFLVWLIGWDFCMNIICLVLFVVPLHKILKAVKRPDDDVVDPNTKKASGKMRFVATKVSVLTIVSCTSTIIAILIGGLIPGFGILLLGIDFMVNSICVAWMTPYYPDDKYFGKFCKLCIACCGGSYQSKASENHELQTSIDYDATPKANQRTSVAPSYDTVDQIKQSAKDCEGDGNNANVSTNASTANI